MQLQLFSYKTAIASLITVIILSPVITIAETEGNTRDMSRLTCEEFMDMDKMEQVMSMVWYSGWSAEKQGDANFTMDRSALSEKKDSLETACDNTPQDLVVDRLQS
jgi:HdeA/HdeB family